MLVPFLFLLAQVPASLFAASDTALSQTPSFWQQVSAHLLTTYVHDTVILVFFSALTCATLGIALAWCTCLYRFPGRRLFEVALFLPLAVPPYIAAYTYDGIFSYTGVCQTLLRNVFHLSPTQANIALPSIPFAIFIFTITLFPYVYLFVRTFLHRQSATLIENAVLLGGGRHVRTFFRVILPLLIPSTLAGVTLASLEVMNDYGVTSYLGLHTFTTAIFTTWFGTGDTVTAIRLSLLLVASVLVFLLLIRGLQNREKYRIVSSKEREYRPQPARGMLKWTAFSLCFLVSLLSFFIPTLQMLAWASTRVDITLFAGLLPCIGNTLYVGGMATLIIVFFAVVSANVHRLFARRYDALCASAAGMGYAVPSAILSMGVVTTFASLDSVLAGWFPSHALPLLGMTVAMLCYAYCIRFYCVGYQVLDTGFSKIGPIYTEVSRTLGYGVTQTFLRVDAPLIRHAIASAGGLVFADIIKELPMALTLRPFNFETLGTRVFEYANNEAIPETAFPSLCIIAVCVVVILSSQWYAERAGYALS
jgi:iron(III) transport system permease protein